MLEIIACSVNDALAAEAGGADRLELISRFDVGGLTPEFELVEEVLAKVKIPVRVMLRENENFNVSDEAEKARLCETAKKLALTEIDGIVCGFLQGAAIDHSLLNRVLIAAKPLKATFHRAFEELPDPLSAILELKKYLQIDCILTSGGQGSLDKKMANLAMCQLAAAPEIDILAGGGMTDETIRQITACTRVRNFHCGTYVRFPPNIFGGVDSERVRKIVGQIQEPSSV